MTTTPRKRVPATAPKPQDHKAKKSAEARQAEADGFVTIEQCGVTLQIPVGGKVPLKAYMAFKNGDEIAGTELLLGPEQWASFLEKDPTVDDFAAIGEKLEELVGN
ncbi:tail assembly chaperone [Mycobacterium phage IdentityCrisis]|uniref:Tail assembly chaperone n=1 Tax=Mycobacterium phage IdentityCrisis TaxID=2599866 RepID=A0A5J6TGG0_9CAUD|nr:tail assembly chaperone [Mycobacterium phage IdentityCrisis]QFG10033.1 tail assembly chaperone [Mycobacterium phage IdentityCrisis]